MITHEVTKTGYRIYCDGKLQFIQEGEHAYVYEGETMEERAQNHISVLNNEPSDSELIVQYEEALNILGVETQTEETGVETYEA